MNKMVLLLGMVVLMGCQSVIPVVDRPASKWTWGFEEYDGGVRPAEWVPAETASKRTPGTWLVAGDAWGKAIALMQSTNTGDTCNLLLAANTRLGNLKMSAKIKTISGWEQHGGGICWRAQNNDNYYYANWNPLESKLGLHAMVNGKPFEIQTVTLHADLSTWHTIAVEHFRSKISVYFDGNLIIALEDQTLTLPGMIGLWTKADACSMYDDIVVEEIK